MMGLGNNEERHADIHRVIWITVHRGAMVIKVPVVIHPTKNNVRA